MVLTVAVMREYVPKWNDNDKLPAAEQIRVAHKAPTVAIKEQVFPKKFELGSDGKVTGTFEVDRKRTISAFSPTITNCAYIMDDGKDKTKKIIDVEGLFSAPSEFDGLIDELYEYFQGLLNAKVAEKN